MTQELPAEDYEAVQQLLAEAQQGGMPVGGMRHLDDRRCETLYALGCSLAERQRHDDAFKVLSVLVAHNHAEHRYLMALGEAAQALGRYRDALQQFAAATLLDPLEPLSVLHSAECLLALGKRGPAEESLSLALEMCRPGRHNAVRSRALALRQAMQGAPA